MVTTDRYPLQEAFPLVPGDGGGRAGAGRLAGHLVPALRRQGAALAHLSRPPDLHRQRPYCKNIELENIIIIAGHDENEKFGM